MIDIDNRIKNGKRITLEDAERMERTSMSTGKVVSVGMGKNGREQFKIRVKK